MSRGRAFEVWKNADGTPAQHTSINDWLRSKNYLKMTSKRYMEFFNEVCKDEGVYELSIGWKGGGGHATILQRFKMGSCVTLNRKVTTPKVLAWSGKTSSICVTKVPPTHMAAEA